MDRRQFLKMAGGFTVVTAGSALTGCNSGVNGGETPDDFKLSTWIQQSVTPGTRQTRPGEGRFKYPQSVAAGDPKSNSLVFWTRVTNADGSDGEIPLKLAISRTADFRIIQVYDVVAKPEADNTVRVKVEGLDPDMHYFYVFVADRDVSPTGRGRTLPEATADVPRLKLAFISGIAWDYNHWSGLSMLTNDESEFDYLVLLGDAIDEMVPLADIPTNGETAAHRPLSLPDGMAVANLGTAARTLADYRYLYKTYRTDVRLQNLLARYTLLPMWGDREFSADHWQDHETYSDANTVQTERRRAATQAWLEHMPVDWSDLHFDSTTSGAHNVRLYRDFRWGNLVHMMLMEQRLERSDHAIREDLPHAPLNLPGPIGARHMVDQDAQAANSGAAATLLGSAQKSWLLDTLGATSSQWKVLGGECGMMRFAIDASSNSNVFNPNFRRRYLLSADQWDGYDAERRELTNFISAKGIKRVLSFSGQGGFFAGEVWRDYSALRDPVMLEFSSGSISSPTLVERVKTLVTQQTNADYSSMLTLLGDGGALDQILGEQSSSWIKYTRSGIRGYTVATFTKDQIAVEFVRLAEALNGQPPTTPFLGSTALVVSADTMNITFSGDK